MKGFTFKKVFSLSAVLVLIVSLFSVSVSAATDELLYNNYDANKIAESVAWADGDAGGSATIDNGALKLQYGSEGWFGTGGGIDTTTFKYLKIRVKGAKGGEGKDFNLNFANEAGVVQTEKSFAELSNSEITTDYQDIYVDLEANNLQGIQGFHFNFHEGVSGTIWIDEISFTNTKGGAATDNGAAASDNGSTTADNTSDTGIDNPKTGDTSNTSLYVLLAAISGLLVVGFGVKGRRA